MEIKLIDKPIKIDVQFFFWEIWILRLSIFFKIYRVTVAMINRALKRERKDGFTA